MVIQDSLETVLHSGFHAVDSELQVLDSGFDISGTWILDNYSNHQGEVGFLELNSGFQSPRFRIPQANMFPDSGFRIPQNFLDFESVLPAPYTGRNLLSLLVGPCTRLVCDTCPAYL